MHNLARNFTARLKQEVVKRGKADEFGEVLQYNKVFFGKCGDECVTVEDFIPGTFTSCLLQLIFRNSPT
jgi:hypothetical protein